MEALSRRPGYTVTRYEGDRVTFDAQNDLFQILGIQSKRSHLLAVCSPKLALVGAAAIDGKLSLRTRVVQAQ